MSEKDLNIKYIQDKTGLVDNDELISIILEMIQESYKAGLCQSEFDNTMGLIEENEELKKQLKYCYCNRTDCSGRIKDSKQYDSLVQKLKNQQQEFIKYLEDEINKWHYNFNNIDYEQEIEEPSTEELIEEILQKYKDIIGNDINVITKGVKDEKDNN